MLRLADTAGDTAWRWSGGPEEHDRMVTFSIPVPGIGGVPVPLPTPLFGGNSVTFPITLPSVVDALAPTLRGAIDASGVSPIAVLADFAAALPGPLRGSDGTPSVPTGASDLSRADALAYTTLATVPRVVETFGPRVSEVVVGDDSFAAEEAYQDPLSGFSAVRLRSLSDNRAVFALNDTDSGSLADVVADLNLARPQVASPAFAAMVADAAAAAVAEGREVVFAGASLGGALAQVAGYETAELVLAAAPGYADRVTVFGVDALGGRDAADAINGGRLDPAVLERMNALNIRTEGDVVSRASSHLGDTITFRPVDAGGNPVLLSAAEAHVNFPSLLATLSSDDLFVAGTRGDPGEIGGLALVANSIAPELSAALADLSLGVAFDRPGPPRLPGTGAIDPGGQFFGLDADGDGDLDLRAVLQGAAANAGDLLIA